MDGTFRTVDKWIFNNIVHVQPVSCVVNQKQLRADTKLPGVVTGACERSAQTNSWAALDFVVTHPSGDQYISTAFTG